jgi:hypothetical protein
MATANIESTVEKGSSALLRATERAQITMYVKYIGEEFPSRATQENRDAKKGAISESFYGGIATGPLEPGSKTPSVGDSWESPWERHGWGRGSGDSATPDATLLARHRFIMVRPEENGCTIYDRPTGGVFSGNKRTYELLTALKQTGSLQPEEHKELVDAFTSAGLALK